MFEMPIPVKNILKRIHAVDDLYTGGGIKGAIRRVYRYLFGLRLKVKASGIAKELDAIAAEIRYQNMKLPPVAVEKLTYIAAYCSEHRPDDTEICKGTLNAINMAMKWPLKKIHQDKNIARLESVMRVYENMGNADMVERVQLTMNIIENGPPPPPKMAPPGRPPMRTAK